MRLACTLASFVIVISVAAFLYWRRDTPQSSERLFTTAVPNLLVSSTTLDVGRGAPEQRLEGTLRLVNRGAKTLEIIDVKPECGCTSVSLTDPKLPSGGSTQLVVALTPEPNSPSQLSKRVTVTLKDDGGKLQQIVLRVQATVVAPKQSILVVPTRIDFENVPIGEERTKEVFLQGDEGLLANLPDTIPLLDTGARPVMQYYGYSERRGYKSVRVILRIRSGQIGDVIDSTETFNITGPEPHQFKIPFRARLVSGANSTEPLKNSTGAETVLKNEP